LEAAVRSKSSGARAVDLPLHKRFAQVKFHDLFAVNIVFREPLVIRMRGWQLLVVHGRSPLAMRIDQFCETSAVFNASIALVQPDDEGPRNERGPIKGLRAFVAKPESSALVRALVAFRLSTRRSEQRRF
jgi:hypothetical protein